MKSPNLDYIASMTAQKISEIVGKVLNEGGKSIKIVKKDDLENIATKTLGVLQSQGIYAAMLFLMSRSGKEGSEDEMSPEERCATEIISWLYSLLSPEKFIENLPKYEDFRPEKKFGEVNASKTEILRVVSEITSDLKKLLLVRDLWEQILIYVRFHAKAYSSFKSEEGKTA